MTIWMERSFSVADMRTRELCEPRGVFQDIPDDLHEVVAADGGCQGGRRAHVELDLGSDSRQGANEGVDHRKNGRLRNPPASKPLFRTRSHKLTSDSSLHDIGDPFERCGDVDLSFISQQSRIRDKRRERRFQAVSQVGGMIARSLRFHCAFIQQNVHFIDERLNLYRCDYAKSRPFTSDDFGNFGSQLGERGYPEIDVQPKRHSETGGEDQEANHHFVRKGVSRERKAVGFDGDQDRNLRLSARASPLDA